VQGVCLTNWVVDQRTTRWIIVQTCSTKIDRRFSASVWYRLIKIHYRVFGVHICPAKI